MMIRFNVIRICLTTSILLGSVLIGQIRPAARIIADVTDSDPTSGIENVMKPGCALIPSRAADLNASTPNAVAC
jgi:hypothetical protein